MSSLSHLHPDGGKNIATDDNCFDIDIQKYKNIMTHYISTYGAMILMCHKSKPGA